MIDSMLEYVIVKVFLYLGVGTFVWRNVSIFEFEYFNTQDIYMYDCFTAWICGFKMFLYLGVGAFIWRNVWIFEYQRWSTSVRFYDPDLNSSPK